MDLWRDLPKSGLRKSFLLRITVRAAYYLVQVNDRCKNQTLELEVVKLICKINSDDFYIANSVLKDILGDQLSKASFISQLHCFSFNEICNSFVPFSSLIDKCSGRQKILKTLLFFLA